MTEKNQRVVMIDDDKDMLVLLVARLSRKGLRAKAFTDPHLAIKHIRAQQPDLIISDIKMPHLNGFDVCQLIRDCRLTQHIPIILITGVESAKEQAGHLRERMSDVYLLSKPFQPDALIDLVDCALLNGSDID
jgi:CheY-like chemotaxis protein